MKKTFTRSVCRCGVRSAVPTVSASVMLAAMAALPALAGEKTEKPVITWGDGHRSVTYAFRGKEITYPRDMLKGKFPPPGAEPEYNFKMEWPVVTMRARWSMSMKGFPVKYRPYAIDHFLMFAGNAQIYEHIFPGQITSSLFKYPPGFLKKAEDPGRFHLAEKMRGKHIAYEITANAGFGAGEYTIETKILVGLSDDGKTVFYHDEPSYISDFLTTRDFLFAARDAGDEMHFEVIMACICSPRRTFRNETMKRVKESGKYFVDRLYKATNSSPTAEKIEETMFKIKKVVAAFEPVEDEVDKKNSQGVRGSNQNNPWGECSELSLAE